MADLFEFLGKTAKGAGDVVGGAGKLAGGVFSHLGTGLKSVRDEARAKAARPGLVNRQLRLEERERKRRLLSEEVERAGGPTSEGGKAVLLKYYRENAPEIMEMMKGAQPFMPAQTPLQEAQTESYESLSGWRDKMAGEVGKGKPKKLSPKEYLDELQDIQTRYYRGEITETAARAQMSLLSRTSDPEFSKPSGLFHFDARKKEPEYLTEEQKRKAAQIKAGLETKAQPPEKTKREKWLAEDFTEAEADRAVRIEAKVEAGATTKGRDILKEMKDWSIIRKGAYDAYGEVTDQETVDRATKRIHNLQQQVLTERATPTPTPTFAPTQGQLMSQISNLKAKGRIVGPRRAGEIVKAYPTIAKMLLKASPDEVEAILGAMADGMTEAELLRFYEE